MKETMPAYELHAVVYREDGWWIARFLEHSLATACRTLEEIPTELERFLTVQIVASLESGVEPFHDLPQAPQRYWDLYEQASADGPHEVRRFRVSGTSASFDARIAA